MQLAFLVAYVALITVACLRSRSVAWLTITIAGTGGLVGALINFFMDRGHEFNRIELQWLLLVTLALVAVLAFVPVLGFSSRAPGTLLGRSDDLGMRRQLLAVWLPAGLLLLGLVVMTSWWTDEFAFLHPVSFLIGHGVAEDNAKWLDFTSQWAAGGPIHQAVAMGGPLELLMTFMGTLMAVISQFALGGFNEVAIAANSVVYGELLMVVLVLFAFAPLAESRFRGARLPAPLVWAGMLVLSTATLVVTNYGHLTLQFTFLMLGLWAATFLSGVRMRRARLLTSMAAAASMTVWLPLNVAAIVICLGWLGVLVLRGVRSGWRAADPVGLAYLVVVSIGILQPVWSSLVYTLAIPSAAEAVGGAVRGVVAAVPALSPVGLAAGLLPFGLADSPLFAATGGTEQTGPLLAVLAAVSVLAAGVFLTPIAGPLRTSLYRRMFPLALLAAIALVIYGLDFWVTGGGPHYGSMKFMFMVAIVALATTLPLALALIDVGSVRAAAGRMTQLRWIGVGAVVVILMVDSMLPRAIALARPQQWSPPIPFNNTSGSYWWPADVNGKATQPIASNPVACVYLPNGATAPSAIVPSGLSDAQRVYACTRQLAGLSGMDTAAQPVVDWLRREWFTNTPAWLAVYDSLAGLPAEVRAKPVILLDDGSNVVGIESLDSLLQRYPKTAGQ